MRQRELLLNGNRYMLKVNLIAFVFLTLCVSISCKKESSYKTRYDDLYYRNSGTVTALLNGKEWKSNLSLTSYFKSIENSDSINITASIFVNGIERQQLVIGMLNLLSPIQKIASQIQYYPSSQVYTINSPQECYSNFFTVDEDVIENTYWAYDDSVTNNQIIIEMFDPNPKLIKGSFECHYTRIKKETLLTQDLPDTLHFTNGRFELHIK